MPKAELTKVLYRSILRFANASQEVPFKIRSADVAEMVPHLGSLAAGDLEGGTAVRHLARQSFRHSNVIEVASRLGHVPPSPTHIPSMLCRSSLLLPSRGDCGRWHDGEIPGVFWNSIVIEVIPDPPPLPMTQAFILNPSFNA